MNVRLGSTADVELSWLLRPLRDGKRTLRGVTFNVRSYPFAEVPYRMCECAWHRTAFLCLVIASVGTPELTPTRA